RIDIGEGVSGGDPTEVVGIIDDGGEEVRCGDDRLAAVDPDGRRIVTVVQAHEQVLIVEPWQTSEEFLEFTRRNFARAAATGRELGESHHRSSRSKSGPSILTGSRLRHWRRTSSGDGRGLQNRCGRATRPGGFDSRPPPPKLRRSERAKEGTSERPSTIATLGGPGPGRASARPRDRSARAQLRHEPGS